jgi:hypothetical protein
MFSWGIPSVLNGGSTWEMVSRLTRSFGPKKLTMGPFGGVEMEL